MDLELSATRILTKSHMRHAWPSCVTGRSDVIYLGMRLGKTNYFFLLSLFFFLSFYFSTFSAFPLNHSMSVSRNLFHFHWHFLISSLSSPSPFHLSFTSVPYYPTNFSFPLPSSHYLFTYSLPTLPPLILPSFPIRLASEHQLSALINAFITHANLFIPAYIKLFTLTCITSQLPVITAFIIGLTWK